jgi:hypothetical protein
MAAIVVAVFVMTTSQIKPKGEPRASELEPPLAE